MLPFKTNVTGKKKVGMITLRSLFFQPFTNGILTRKIVIKYLFMH